MKRLQQRMGYKVHSSAILPRQELAAAASLAKYVGSPEHTEMRRADASRCPKELAFDSSCFTQWLQAAITSGHIAGPVESGLPRYVWHREETCVFQGRLTNSGLGQYKGWPVEESELPDWLRGLL